MKVRTGVTAGQGLGDAVADMAQLTGMDRLAKAYEQASGNSCGCKERQEALNRIFSFNPAISNS
jgi:hypothetical protein